MLDSAALLRSPHRIHPKDKAGNDVFVVMKTSVVVTDKNNKSAVYWIISYTLALYLANWDAVSMR